MFYTVCWQAGMEHSEEEASGGFMQRIMGWGSRCAETSSAPVAGSLSSGTVCACCAHPRLLSWPAPSSSMQSCAGAAGALTGPWLLQLAASQWWCLHMLCASESATLVCSGVAACHPVQPDLDLLDWKDCMDCGR